MPFGNLLEKKRIIFVNRDEVVHRVALPNLYRIEAASQAQIAHGPNEPDQDPAESATEGNTERRIASI